MKHFAVAFLVLIVIVQPAVAQTLTPPEAQATAEMARAQATSVSRLATANAPTKTPVATLTPMPSATPWPTATMEPTNTATVEPTNTAQPTPTMQPVAAAAPVVRDASEPTPTSPAKGRTIYDDWPLLLLLGIGALVMVVAAWRLIDGKTITLPGRNDK